ncbi:MAG: cytochrome c oxidase subunit [Actinomycetota bacterium]|nr:cytochrome c oxidase subunit [Actinomycetota bacterium]
MATVAISANPRPDGGGIMRRLNVLTGIVIGAMFAYVGWLIAHTVIKNANFGNDADDIIMLVAWALGFLIGIGAFVGPVRWAFGRDLSEDDKEYMAGKDQSWTRYLRFCTDHKVVGVQYLVLGMTTLGIGGVMAMIIRTELMRPGARIVNPQTYNALVGLHGIIMIISLSVIITGPFGNFILPIMIGARDMAFPRLNALSFWTLFAAVIALLSAFFLGGIPTGWNSYAPLSVQAPAGMDAYLVGIFFFTVASGVAAVNVIVTSLSMRTKGMTWSRVPIFVWGIIAAALLSLIFLPAFQAAMVLLGTDRALGTTFFVPAGGGNAWLYENLFWIFGHPEVYLILLPGVGAILEIVPVFARKPLFSYKGAVLGLVGVCSFSALVWAHHMFTTGWAPGLNAAFMLTTEIISIPTGLVFLVILGTLWRGRIWTRTAMMFVYAFLWNFVIGGVSGIFLSDVPLNYQLHGSLFVTAHFHYTLVGGGLMGFFAAIYYWFPKISGKMLDETLGKVSFWFIQIGFNLTFFFMMYVGLQGQPRRVADYAKMFATGNLISTIGAYILGAGMLIFLWNVITTVRQGERAADDPWGAKTLEWTTPTPVPLENFAEFPVVTSDPYGYGEHPAGVPASPVPVPGQSSDEEVR